MFSAALAGYALSLSLILAIGAQNAFVLRQGLRNAHVFWVCLLCAVSDAVLIVAGIAGIGALTEAVPWIAPVMRYGGAAFLIGYGALSFRNALRGGAALRAGDGQGDKLGRTLLTVAALTWLNPHVYLDTVLLIGSISAQYQDRVSFGAGAVLASFSFFFALGYGARLVAPVFARPRAWQVLDVVVGLIMWAIAIKLIVS